MSREDALREYRNKIKEHEALDDRIKTIRVNTRNLDKQFDQTEEDMKSLQSVGQIIGEVLKQLDNERFIVKASSGPRYVVHARPAINQSKLKQGVRV